MLGRTSQVETKPSELSPALGMTEFELATGYICGTEPGGGPPVPVGEAPGSPLEALEEAVLPALARGPCFVSFSGGRDSSTVLAAAAAAARREGLAPPVPATLVFPNAPKSKEAEWQERVIAWLSLSDWRRVEIDDDGLDYIGPVAQEVLRRHGVLYPFNAHFYVPLVEAIGGGTLLTGGGGDGLLDNWRWQREALILTRQARPRPRQLPRLAYFAAPLPVRRVAVARTISRRRWLTPRGQALFRRAVARDADEPRRFDARVEWFAARRSVALARRSADILGAEGGVRIEHPWMEPRVRAAFARAGGRWGPGDRTMAMRRFFASVLPDDLLARPTKASFDEPLFNDRTREFLGAWNGRSPFPELVDPAGFRSSWGEGAVPHVPRLLLQATWLAVDGGLV